MITQFKDEHRFLSNFSPCTIEMDGLTFSSVEHAFVAAKTLDPALRAQVQEMAPGQAKRFGRTFELREHWDEIKLNIMYELVEQKFQLPIYRELLLDTGTQDIVEGNTWGDKYWGVSISKDGELEDGCNHLGKILMNIRASL